MELIQKGLYLLHEEKFIETNKTIYKIGKSDNIYSRVNQYPNGTIVYLIIESDNITKHETELIDLFNKKYKQIRYYGYEYFEGELETMKQTIIDYIQINNILENIKIINEAIKIERVNKDTNLPIPKYTQELYTKAKLNTISKNNTNVVDNSNNTSGGNANGETNDNIAGNLNNNTIVTNAKDNKNKKQFECSHCNRLFASKYSLERHYSVCKVFLLKQETINNNDNARFNKLVSIISDLIVDNRKLVNEYKKQMDNNSTF